MRQKMIYSVRGSISFGNKLFAVDEVEEAVEMYNCLIRGRNKAFNENNALATKNDVIFKGIVYVND